MVHLNYLSRSDMDSVHNATLEVLETTGVAVQNEAALKHLTDHGAIVDGNMVRIPSNLVDEMIKKPPKAFQLFSRDGAKGVTIGGNEVVFNPASSSIFFKDGKSGEIRKAIASDLVRFIRVAEQMAHIAAQSTAMIPSDVPVAISDLYRLYLVLKESRKPIITGAFTKEGLLNMKRILEVMAGGEEELTRKPRAVFDCCPLSVLIWGDVSTQNLIDCASYGIPAAIVPAPLIGATSPVTLGGTLVQVNAEVLSGIVISQLVNPGAPIIYGGATSVLDQRYGTSSIAAPEAVLIACASAEMGKYYGVPTHAYLGVTDSKALDVQSGYESALGLVQAALTGINLVSGPGMLLSINCQSLEKLVFDNEICGAAFRMREGITFDGLDEIPNLIHTAGPGGNFLKEKHTRVNLRRDHIFPSDIISRITQDAWTNGGSANSLDMARNHVKSLLDSYDPVHLEPNKLKLLNNEMKAIITESGLDTSFFSLLSS